MCYCARKPLTWCIMKNIMVGSRANFGSGISSQPHLHTWRSVIRMIKRVGSNIVEFIKLSIFQQIESKVLNLRVSLCSSGTQRCMVFVKSAFLRPSSLKGPILCKIHLLGFYNFYLKGVSRDPQRMKTVTPPTFSLSSF